MRGAGYHDLHLHVLPGIDDGARNLEASLEMMRGLADLGFERLVATPHYDAERHTYGPERISALRDQVAEAALAAGVEIELGWGAEYAYGQRFHQDVTQKNAVTLNGSRYVLLELPEAFMPASMADTLFQVGAAGYYPVLAHPERCEPFHDDVPRLEALAGGRALIQVSFRSLAGTFGRAIKRTAWTLVTEDIADLVATDCHSPRELKKIVRPVLKQLARRIDADHQDRLMRRLPAKMMAAEGNPTR